MAVMCTACGNEIHLGHDSVLVSSGLIKSSKKSGRNYHEEHNKDPVHADIHCQLLYLANLSTHDPGLLAETLTEMVRERIAPDLQAELEDEFTLEKRDELREEMIDELGRTCAVCSEDLETIRYELDEDDYSPPAPQVQTGWFQSTP